MSAIAEMISEYKNRIWGLNSALSEALARAEKAEQVAKYEADVAEAEIEWRKKLQEENTLLKAQRDRLLGACSIAEKMLIEQEGELRRIGCEYPNAESSILTCREAIIEAESQLIAAAAAGGVK